MTIPDQILSELRLHRALLMHLLNALDVNADAAADNHLQETRMAKKLADYVDALTAKIAELKTDVAAQSTVVGSVKTLVEGQVAQVAALKQQVQDLLDAGGDTTTLQPILDALNAQEAALQANTEGLIQAVLQGTPAAAD